MKTLVDQPLAAAVDAGVLLDQGTPGADNGTQILEPPAAGEYILVSGIMLYLAAGIVAPQWVSLYTVDTGDTCASASRRLIPGGRIVVPYDAGAPYLDSRWWTPQLAAGVFKLEAGKELWGIITTGNANGVHALPELVIGRTGSAE